jgi:hypothetical protein
MHEYGKANWEGLWEKLEQAGNVGIDYVINPSLYPHIIHFLTNNPKAIVVDFGCGTNLMGIQLLFGYKDSIPALKDSQDVDRARFNTLLYIGVEGSQELVSQANRYLGDIGKPKNIGTVQRHIDNSFGLFDGKSIDLCVSRNFLMHLSAEDFSFHMEYVSRILKSQSYYIFTILNPKYELIKAMKDMANGEKYEFLHGKTGEYGTFYHYYKTTEYLREIIEKYFDIEKIEPCIPISDEFKETHTRYYESEPMALTYVLKVK